MQFNSKTFFTIQKCLFLFLCIFHGNNLTAQNKGINYQAVIIDPNPIEIPGNKISGQPLSNGKVCLRFSIVSSDGTVDYIETHSTQTDEFGLVNITIGDRNSSSSDIVTLGKGAVSEFNNIKWDSKVKSLKVALSFDNCTSFKEIANQPFNYTPYALYAGAVEYKNVDGAPTNVSHFTNDVGYLVPNDLNPVKNDLANTTLNLNKFSLKADSTFKVVQQHLTSLDSTNLVSSAKFKIMDAALLTNTAGITNNTNLINQTQASLNQQVGNLQGQINATNSTINQLATTYEVIANKSTDTTLGAASPSNSLYPSQLAVKTYVDVTVEDAVATGAPDASTLAKGKIKLAGDLSGTADLPTVPSLSLKENVSNKSNNIISDGTSESKYPSVKAIKEYVDGQVTGSTITSGTSSQYYRGDKTWQTLDKTAVGLTNVDNTSDANKPISTATQTALNLKLAKVDTASLSNRIDARELLANKSNDSLLGNSTVLYPTQRAVKAYVDGQITGSSIAAGTSSQYYRGDKTWQTLDKSAVGLADVDNTSDVNKPISTATQTALNLKLAKVDTASLSNRIDARELLVNKSNDSLLGNSTVLYPTQRAVKAYVDGQITGSSIAAGTSTQYYRGDKTWQTLDKSAVGLSNVDNTSDANKPISIAIQSALDLKELLANKSNDTLLGNSTTKYPTQKAVKSYVDEMAAGAVKYPATAGVEGQVLTANNTGVAVWQSPIIVHEVTDEFTATAGQTVFRLSYVKSVYSKVKMNINGIRVSYSSYTVTDDVLTYIPANNEGANLVAGDRIQMEYYY